jgi:hypothetical protein
LSTSFGFSFSTCQIIHWLMMGWLVGWLLWDIGAEMKPDAKYDDEL